jgi:hypothetical protein
MWTVWQASVHGINERNVLSASRKFCKQNLLIGLGPITYSFGTFYFTPCLFVIAVDIKATCSYCFHGLYLRSSRFPSPCFCIVPMMKPVPPPPLHYTPCPCETDGRTRFYIDSSANTNVCHFYLELRRFKIFWSFHFRMLVPEFRLVGNRRLIVIRMRMKDLILLTFYVKILEVRYTYWYLFTLHRSSELCVKYQWLISNFKCSRWRHIFSGY